jgi:hypothetical protein
VILVVDPNLWLDQHGNLPGTLWAEGMMEPVREDELPALH